MPNYPKITVKKYEGDDDYSWAVFRSDKKEPAFTGLSKPETKYYKTMVEGILRNEFPIFIERTEKDGSVTVIDRFKTFDEAMKKLEKIKSPERHAILYKLGRKIEWKRHKSRS